LGVQPNHANISTEVQVEDGAAVIESCLEEGGKKLDFILSDLVDESLDFCHHSKYSI